MPRAILTKSVLPRPYADAGAILTMTAADTSDQNRFLLTGREIIVAHNTGASTRTVTITSIEDSMGRVNHLGAENILTGAYHIYGPGLALEGWLQADGYCYLEANHADVKFGVIVLP